MTELPEPFRLRILTRCRVAGIKLVPGQVLHVSPDRLQVAAWLCSNGSAKPADATTATSIVGAGLNLSSFRRSERACSS